ncbi:MAG: type II toxin-antitoxin system PemK/MazF family toxin [Cryomorphaceae bacterium]
MKQGDIWLINLDPTIGAEIKKTRPASIVNEYTVGRLPLKVIVPLTDWKDRYQAAPWMVKITPAQKNKLTKSSSAACFQVRSLSEQRFVKKIGAVNVDTLERMKDGLSVVLSIGS